MWQTEPLLPAGDPTLLSNRKWFPPFIPSLCHNLTGFGKKPVCLSSSLTTCFSHRTAGNSLHVHSILTSIWFGRERHVHLCHSLLLSDPPSVQARQTAQPVSTEQLAHTPPFFPHSAPLSLLSPPSLCLTCRSAKSRKCSLSFQGGNKKELLRATPASLTVTVSFPASFLLSTKHIIGISN